MFAIITEMTQKEFEIKYEGQELGGLPCICGYYGRACRQMNKPEGANRVLCYGCPLAEFASAANK